jgi:hypothetical protein
LIFQSDFVVPVQVDDDFVNLINENIAAGVHFLKPKLNAIRRYLSECRLREFTIGDGETKMIENDFVKMREDRKEIQVEHLHSLLVISRLIGISKGLTSLHLDEWEMAKRLEVERINRVGKIATIES